MVKAAPFAHAHMIVNRGPWYTNPRLCALNGWIIALLLVSTLDSFALGLGDAGPYAVQTLPYWKTYFGKPDGGKLGIISAMPILGQVAALPISPYVMDILGRRLSIWFGLFFLFVASVLQAASLDLAMFTAARFLLGFSLPFSRASALLIAELAFPTQRAQATAMVGPFSILGAVLSSWTMVLVQRIAVPSSWRIISITHALLAFSLSIILIWCPESPRWLSSMGREAEAIQLLAYYQTESNIDHPLIHIQIEEIQKDLGQQAGGVNEKNVQGGSSKREQRRRGWMALFTTKGGFRRLRMMIFFALFSLLSGEALIGPYLRQVLISIAALRNSKTQLLISSGLDTWKFIVGITAAFAVERAGRRRLFLVALFGMFAVWACMTATFGVHQEASDRQAGSAFVALVFVFEVFHNMAFAPLLTTYVLEILPFHQRAKGISIFSLLETGSDTLSAYVSPLLLKAARMAWWYLAVYLVWIAWIFAIVFFFLVETKGLTLEETSRLFDKEISNIASPPDASELMDYDDDHYYHDHHDAEQGKHGISIMVEIPLEREHSRTSSIYSVDSIESVKSIRGTPRSPPRTERPKNMKRPPALDLVNPTYV